MLKKITGLMNNFFVSSYKLVGFVALLVILLGLCAYLVVNAFFLLNHSWLAPVLLTPTDSKVVNLNAQVLAQNRVRNQLKFERRQTEVELADLDRTIRMNKAFQKRFDLALEKDLSTHQQQLARVINLQGELDKTRAQIDKSRSDFKGFTKKRLDDERSARLIGENEFVAGQNMLANMEQSELSLEEKNVRVGNQASELRRAIRALKETRGALEQGMDLDATVPHTDYATLLKQKEYLRSVQELVRAIEQRELVAEKVSLVETSIQGYDSLVSALETSAYFQAFHKKVTLGFLPYDNLDDVKPGDAVYGCALELVWCSKVGTVGKVLDGEVAGVHPLRNRPLRGVMAELNVEGDWGKEKVLFVGSAPFFF